MILAYVILPALPHYLPLPALLLMTLHINSAIVGISQKFIELVIGRVLSVFLWKSIYLKSANLYNMYKILNPSKTLTKTFKIFKVVNLNLI